MAASGLREVGGVKLLARAVEGVETKDLKSLVDDGKKQIGSGVVAIVGVTEDGKAGVVVGVTADLTSRFSAVELVKIASERSAARAAAGGPTWRRPAGPTAPRRTRRCRRSKRRWPAPERIHYLKKYREILTPMHKKQHLRSFGGFLGQN